MLAVGPCWIRHPHGNRSRLRSSSRKGQCNALLHTSGGHLVRSNLHVVISGGAGPRAACRTGCSTGTVCSSSAPSAAKRVRESSQSGYRSRFSSREFVQLPRIRLSVAERRRNLASTDHGADRHDLSCSNDWRFAVRCRNSAMQRRRNPQRIQVEGDQLPEVGASRRTTIVQSHVHLDRAIPKGWGHLAATRDSSGINCKDSNVDR